MRKRILSALLSLVLIVSIVPAAFAATDEANSAADALYQQGLFNGTGKDAQGNPIFDLDRTPTRFESVTMLVRLLGKASEAESGTYGTPFVDVVEWAKPYVGYAYENKLTSGTSGTTFGGEGNVTASQYITFVLRALGYESGVDFQWDKAWELSDKLGITSGQYNASTTNFTRGDVVIISFNALSAKIKGTDITLHEDLTARGVVKEHTHNYVTKTVPGSGTGGHWEQVQVGTEKIIVRYETRQYSKCNGCGAIAYTNEEMYGHYDPESPYFSPSCAFATNLIYTEQVPIYEEQPKYENKWIEDSPTTIRVCEICGQREP